jgi:hypothetical protein
MGRGAKDKVTHPLRQTEITKVQWRHGRPRPCLHKSAMRVEGFAFLRVPEPARSEAEGCPSWFVVSEGDNHEGASGLYFIPSRIEPTIPPTTPPSTVFLEASRGRYRSIA